MKEKFIERGTDYQLSNGKLSVYETNCFCKNIKFFFNQHVLTLMLSGHKTVSTQHMKLEFFPGTFFIPQKGVINEVSIPNATYDHPTKCLVLELDPAYIQSVYEEVLYSEKHKELLHKTAAESSDHHYFSSDKLLIRAFTQLYLNQHQDRSPAKDLIDDLVTREILLRVFHTKGLHLLRMNFEQSIQDERIRRVVTYIRNNIQAKFTAEDLAERSGLGQTSFFNKFKKSTGYSPIDFILHERISQAKVMIMKNRYDLQDIAYRCGFNSYEYFCTSFRKIENLRPSDFKKENIRLASS